MSFIIFIDNSGNCEEKMKILNMIQEGKITAEQGAKLLEALEESEPEEKTDSHSTTGTAKFVKIIVTDIDTGKIKVNLSIPMGIAYIIKSLRFIILTPCPMPYALCPMPYAPCPMPHALCPILLSFIPIKRYL